MDWNSGSVSKSQLMRLLTKGVPLVYDVDIRFENTKTVNVPLADQPMTLSAGSMVRYSFSDFVDAAGATGYAAISVTKRLCHLARSRENLTVTDMKLKLADHNLHVAEIEGTPEWLSGADADDPRVLDWEEALDLAERLNAPCVVAYHDERPGGSRERFCADFALACDHAHDRGLKLALEFLPWTPISTLADALAIVKEAARPNGGILFDTWHHSFGSSSVINLTADEASRIFCLQIDDAR
jgi:sugar phosphate isomerase/epimerase